MNLSYLFPSTPLYTRKCNRPHHLFCMSSGSKLKHHSRPRSFTHARNATMAAAAVNRQTTQEENTRSTRLIFTYGTLKKGFYNHALMEDLISTRDASFVGEYTTVESFPLVIGPYGIPFLINLPGSGYKIPGELYAVSGRGLARLDDLEGIEMGHYERLPVAVNVVSGGEVVEVEGYFAHRSFGMELWRKCGEKGFSEFSKEMGGMYVKRANRPLGCNFVDDVWKFISQ